MEKLSIIGTPPNPFKKGGPASPLDNFKCDGEQPEDTFISEVPMPKFPMKKSKRKRKKK